MGSGKLEILAGGFVSSKDNATNWETGSVLINGGQLDVGQTLTNAGKFVVGDQGGTIFGHVNNINDGTIATYDGGTANYLGNVIHNGQEIYTDALGTTRFAGEVTGNGRYTGTGLVLFDDTFLPGNSPAEINFDGDVEFGSNALVLFELGGLNAGEFDSLDIAGDLAIAGEISVSLWDQFQLDHGQQFLIADVDGMTSGQFDGLGEGDLVTEFGGVNLFISYRAGNGNDVVLFSSVPEPGACSLGLLVLLKLALVRRKRRPLA